MLAQNSAPVLEPCINRGAIESGTLFKERSQCLTPTVLYRKMMRACEDPAVAQKVYGTAIGRTLIRRIAELRAATSLLDVSNLPASGLHALAGSRNGEYALTLAQPHRLIITASDMQGGSSMEPSVLACIRIVRAEEVVDYHGKS